VEWVSYFQSHYFGLFGDLYLRDTARSCYYRGVSSGRHYGSFADDAKGIRSTILFHDVNDDDGIVDGTESDGDYLETRESDLQCAEDARSDDHCCTHREAIDNCCM
jgi:hypothetical protein